MKHLKRSGLDFPYLIYIIEGVFGLKEPIFNHIERGEEFLSMILHMTTLVHMNFYQCSHRNKSPDHWTRDNWAYSCDQEAADHQTVGRLVKKFLNN